MIRAQTMAAAPALIAAALTGTAATQAQVIPADTPGYVFEGVVTSVSGEAPAADMGGAVTVFVRFDDIPTPSFMPGPNSAEWFSPLINVSLPSLDLIGDSGEITLEWNGTQTLGAR